MDLPKNTFKAAINAGRQQIGLWNSINDPVICEMLAGCGYDWMLIDCEHSTMGPQEVLSRLQAVAPYPVQPVVRPSILDAAEIKKIMDVGALSILVPYVQNADEARLAAAAVDYPPGGMRGVAGITRASRFGTIPGYHARAREEVCLLVQIETKEAMANLEDIAAVPGVDGVFIGPSDMAASLGHPGNPAHPDVQAACLDAVRRVRAAGKPAGFLTPDQSFLPQIIEAGSLFTAVDVDLAILRRNAVARAEEWQARIRG